MSNVYGNTGQSRKGPGRKKSLDDLAMFHGEPTFQSPLHVGAPNMVNRQLMLERLAEVLSSGRLTNGGEFVQRFETAIAERVGVRHCVATCNGTAALQIAAKGLGMRNEVIMPSMTFVATAHALAWQQMRPVFADIDAHSWTLDPRSVQECITTKTGGIVGVHLWGHACDIEALSSIARKAQVPLLFDASHAFGCEYAGRPIGGFGDAETFSFHATKFVNSAEGGAVVTNDSKLAERLCAMRNFGFSQPGVVDCVGTNAKMSEISAAIGLTSIENMDQIVEVNKRNFACYIRETEGISGLRWHKCHPDGPGNYQYVVMDVDESQFGLSRDLLLELLRAENVLVRRYFHPGCHRFGPYASAEGRELPQTACMSTRVLAFPTGLAVSPRDIAEIGRLIRWAHGHAGDLQARLANRQQNIRVDTSWELGFEIPATLEGGHTMSQ